MALIEIENMSFYAYHGCFKAENVVGTRFEVQLTLEVDTSTAEQSDKLADTLNYQAVYEVVKLEMMKTSKLLEHVASRILDALFKSFLQIQHAQIKVSKLNPPIGGEIGAVSVTLKK